MPIIVQKDAFIGALGKKTRRLNSDIEAAVNDAAYMLQDDMRGVLSRWGFHPYGTKSPSPPGSTPAMITGRLRESVTVKPAVRTGFDTYKAEVGPTVVYARAQEEGNPNPGWFAPNTIPARPYLEASRAMSRRHVERTMILAVERSLS